MSGLGYACGLQTLHVVMNKRDLLYALILHTIFVTTLCFNLTFSLVYNPLSHFLKI